MIKDTVVFFQTSTASPSREKIAGVYRYLESSGWQIQLIEENLSPKDIPKFLLKWKPIGCIIERGLTTYKNPVRAIGRTPTVYIDQNPKTATKGIWCIQNNAAPIVKMAFQELTRLSPAHYAFVRSRDNQFWSIERESSFQRLVCQIKAKCTILDNDLNLPENIAALPKPCGLLAANDHIAQKVIDAAHKKGISMPTDLQIVGINNDEFICTHTNPTLTSIHPDFEGCGFLAMATLHRIIKGTTARPQTIFFGPKEIIRRASTRIFKRNDSRVTCALDFIAAHYSDCNLKTETIAAAMGCSRGLADLRFKEVTGRTIRDEIRHIRLEAAKRLLNDPTRVLSSIPSLCGYLSLPTFANMFKKETGMTMRGWRNCEH